MKNVYLNLDNTVREILPSEAVPIAEWYNEDFASRCVEAPDEVEQGWKYDQESEAWYSPENDFYNISNHIVQEVIDEI